MNKHLKIIIAACLVLILLLMSFGAGCIIFDRFTGGRSGPNYPLIEQAWLIVNRNYVESDKIDYGKLNQGAIKGMVDSLDDPYSAFLDPETFKLVQSDLKGSFSGIGAQVSLNENNQPVIVAPLEGSPAERAGIRTGDVIVAIDDKPTEGMSLTEAVLFIRGPEGTPVRLHILREGETVPVELELVREVIDAPSISYEMKEGIAYIRIRSFSEETGAEFNRALLIMHLNIAEGMIIDLRENTGGAVPAVVDVASHFIRDKAVITLVDNQGNKETLFSKQDRIFVELPLVVLVDRFSASGSEVLAGALQDYERATIAGVRTLGKGSYNSLFPLLDDSAIYLTIGRWLTPSGREIEGQGIEPDIILEDTGDSALEWAIAYLKQAGK